MERWFAFEKDPRIEKILNESSSMNTMIKNDPKKAIMD